MPLTFVKENNGVGIQQLSSCLFQFDMRSILSPFTLFALTALTSFTHNCRNSNSSPFTIGTSAAQTFPFANAGKPVTGDDNFFQPLIVIPPLITGCSPPAASIKVGDSPPSSVRMTIVSFNV